MKLTADHTRVSDVPSHSLHEISSLFCSYSKGFNRKNSLRSLQSTVFIIKLPNQCYCFNSNTQIQIYLKPTKSEYFRPLDIMIYVRKKDLNGSCASILLSLAAEIKFPRSLLILKQSRIHCGYVGRMDRNTG